MASKRVLTVQDLSCVGQCSLAAALPILTACGLEACPLPTQVLSTHTGGFTAPAVRSLGADLPAIQAHWQREGICFDAVYMGYIGDLKEARWAHTLFKTVLSPNGVGIVDPVMGDNGRLYAGFDSGYVSAIRALCAAADVILPNVTEGCLLAGIPCPAAYDENFIRQLLERLGAVCPQVVLTGVEFGEGRIGTAIYREGHIRCLPHERLGGHFYGTGDIFASAFTGAWMQGRPLEEAAEIGAELVLRCIRATLDDPEHWYGVKLEAAMPWLIHRIFDTK